MDAICKIRFLVIINNLMTSNDNAMIFLTVGNTGNSLLCEKWRKAKRNKVMFRHVDVSRNQSTVCALRQIETERDTTLQKQNIRKQNPEEKTKEILYLN